MADPGGWHASAELSEEVRRAALIRLRAKWPGLSDADREDLAQETVIAVNRAVAKGEPILNPAAWATTVAHRRAQDLVERQARVLPEEDDELSPSAAVARFVAGNSATSYQAMLREQATRLLAGLDEDDLQLLWLLEGQGMSHAEAAELLGLKPDSVKKRIQRLRARVRGEADDLGLDDEPGEHPRVY